MCVFPLFYFYDSLTRLTQCKEITPDEQTTFLEKVVANQDKFRIWMHYAPMNYAHKFELVEAEKCRVLGNNTEAIDRYERAIAELRQMDISKNKP